MTLDSPSVHPSQRTTEMDNIKMFSSTSTVDHALLIKDIVGPLVKEVQDFKELVQTEYTRLQSNYSKLEGIITNQQQTISKLESTINTNHIETMAELTNKITINTGRINLFMTENKVLKKENDELKE